MHCNGEPLTFGIFCFWDILFLGYFVFGIFCFWHILFFLDQTDDHDPVTQCNQTPPFSDYVRELF